MTSLLAALVDAVLLFPGVLCVAGFLAGMLSILLGGDRR